MAKDKEKGREAIFAAAQEVFARKGVGDAALDDIAKEAKIDLKQVKAAYGSVDAIFDEVVARDIEETSELFTKIMNDLGKADIKLTRLVRELVQRYEKSKSLFQAISIGLDTGGEDEGVIRKALTTDHITRFRQNTAIVGRLIAQGQSENLFTDVDPLEAAYLLRGMIGAAIRFRRIAYTDDDMRDHAAIIMRVFLKGLLR